MKRFFSPKSKQQQPQPSSKSQQAPLHGQQPHLTSPTLTPKFTVPPLPHPNPYDDILLLVTSSGLLLRSATADPSSCLRIRWSKEAEIEQVEGSQDSNWDAAVSVHGIVGILQLFTHSHLLVVTSRKEVGHHLDATHIVYAVKNVTSIPLTHHGAQACLNGLASSRTLRPALVPNDTLDSLSDSPKVHFADNNATHASGQSTPTTSASEVGSDREDDDPDGQDVVVSPSSSDASSMVAKTIASRLSFWNFNKSRATASATSAATSLPETVVDDTSDVPTPRPDTVEFTSAGDIGPSTLSILQDAAVSGLADSPRTSMEPIAEVSNATAEGEVTSSHIGPNTNVPPTSAEKHSELEEKIVRECVKEFCKGTMYFAYTFDITRSLQHKHEIRSQESRNNTRPQTPVTPSVQLAPESPSELSSSRARSKSPSPPGSPKNQTGATSPKGKASTSTLNGGSTVDEFTCTFEDPSSTLPLWRRVDRQFWWNESLIRPFVDAGLHNYVLPIMQGYFQIASFTVPEPQIDPRFARLPPSRSSTLDAPTAEAGLSPLPEFLGSRASADEVQDLTKVGIDTAVKTQLTGAPATAPPSGLDSIQENTATEASPTAKVTYAVVSRRSKYRAGFRYQRRGIDDEARVANFVETETVVSIEREGKMNVFAYVQTRGSIPLFWTQSGIMLKPPPVLSPDRTHEQNLRVLRNHFQRTVATYGPNSIVNLAEQHGKEGSVTQAYREYVTEMASEDVHYYDYDFHVETKGMKYENISKLIDAMEKTFDHQGYFWVSGRTLMSKQKGAFRVNCIDCLDRTNVVQSAFAKYVLNKQLSAVALLNPSLEGHTNVDVVFNDVWANNGDAISRAYAGTSALKGDFTRTGKRDLSGLLNDGVNSLARMYTSTFSDWFSQAVIDFLVGNRSLSVFSEFLLKLQSSDPRDLIRLSKFRAEAIATSVERVLEEGESLRNGWTLFSPVELSTKMGEKWEEKVLLLTARALYIISYDYTLQIVKLYTRVPLGDIIGVTKGAYILSPLEEASRDPKQNAGFVVRFSSRRHVTRTASYSVRNSLPTPPTTPSVKRTTFPSVATAALKKSFSRRNILPGSTPTPAAVSASAPAQAAPQTNVSPHGEDRAEPVASALEVIEALNQEPISEEESTLTYAAFKALPIDPTRTRMSAGGGSVLSMADPADDLMGAKDCEEAVSLIVGCIKAACEEAGNVKSDFLQDEDVVSLTEAQRVTSVYAKMEYGIKRLLWLGG